MAILDRTLRFTGVPRFETLISVNPSPIVPVDETWEVEALSAGGGDTNSVYLHANNVNAKILDGPAGPVGQPGPIVGLTRRLLMVPGSSLEADFGSLITAHFVRWKLGG